MEFVLDKTLIKVDEIEKTVSEEKFTPHVIEPAFGIGRILYALLEHSFRTRDKNDYKRSFLSLLPRVAPIKCSILTVVN